MEGSFCHKDNFGQFKRVFILEGLYINLYVSLSFVNFGELYDPSKQ